MRLIARPRSRFLISFAVAFCLQTHAVAQIDGSKHSTQTSPEFSLCEKSLNPFVVWEGPKIPQSISVDDENALKDLLGVVARGVAHFQLCISAPVDSSDITLFDTVVMIDGSDAMIEGGAKVIPLGLVHVRDDGVEMVKLSIGLTSFGVRAAAAGGESLAARLFFSTSPAASLETRRTMGFGIPFNSCVESPTSFSSNRGIAGCPE